MSSLQLLLWKLLLSHIEFFVLLHQIPNPVLIFIAEADPLVWNPVPVLPYGQANPLEGHLKSSSSNSCSLA